MFPENNTRKAYDVKIRFPEKYKVILANTKRQRSSAITYMQKLLNNNYWIDKHIVKPVKSEILVW